MPADPAARRTVTAADLARLSEWLDRFENADDPVSEQARGAEVNYRALVDELFRACLKTRCPVARATRLCRPATRRTEWEQRFEPMRTAFLQRGAPPFRSAGRRPERARRPLYPLFKQALSAFPCSVPSSHAADQEWPRAGFVAASRCGKIDGDLRLENSNWSA